MTQVGRLAMLVRSLYVHLSRRDWQAIYTSSKCFQKKYFITELSSNLGGPFGAYAL